MNIPLKNIICPVCDAELTNVERMAKCPNRHSFDYAKEEYLNLLLSNQRHSKEPGDSREMIAARHQFLNSGAYAPIVDAIDNLIPTSPLHALDCGCGEGYFAQQLALKKRFTNTLFYGIDISKPAIKCAAKNDKQKTWVIGNIMQKLPIKTASMDLILSILAPRHVEEIERVLTDNGCVIVGIPGPEHLIELRQLLLDKSERFAGKLENETNKFSPFFNLHKSDDIRYRTTLTNEQLQHLTKMTPMYWKSSKAGIENVLMHRELKITVHMQLLLFTKRGRI